MPEVSVADHTITQIARHVVHMMRMKKYALTAATGPPRNMAGNVPDRRPT